MSIVLADGKVAHGISRKPWVCNYPRNGYYKQFHDKKYKKTHCGQMILPGRFDMYTRIPINCKSCLRIMGAKKNEKDT